MPLALNSETDDCRTNRISKLRSENYDSKSKEKTYSELSKEFRELYPTALYAFQLIPTMYDRLTLVEKLSHTEALNKIWNDHKDIAGFSRRNIHRNLPSDNPNVPHRVVTSRHKSIGTDSNEVPELSVAKSTNGAEEYIEEEIKLDELDELNFSQAQECPHCASNLKRIQELEGVVEGRLNFLDSDAFVGTGFKIPKEKFEILTVALEKSRQVCFVIFDTSGKLVKAEADIDQLTREDSKKSKNDK